MAMTPATYDFSRTDDRRKNLEIFSLIWFDIDFEKSPCTEQTLRSTINYMTKFNDVDKCKTYIEQTSIYDRLVIIVSDELSEKLVRSIHHFRQVTAIYIYSKDMESTRTWICDFVKVSLN